MGEMKKLEEVAKAIAAEDLDDGDGLYDWYALVDEVADEYRAMAKAAIEAMKKPTVAMKKSATFWSISTSNAGDDSFDYVSEEDAGDIFDTMLGAALKE